MDNLVIDTMESYNNYIKGVPSGCQIIAKYLRENRVQEALKLVLDFSEGMSWLIKVNSLLEKNGHINSLEPQKIHEFLNEINLGLEKQDFVLVADMFEYEISPFFETCTVYEMSSFQ